MRGNGTYRTVPVRVPRYGPVCVSSRTCKKAGVSYLMMGCRDKSSFSGIIPVKPGWLVGMHNTCMMMHGFTDNHERLYNKKSMIPIVHTILYVLHVML